MINRAEEIEQLADTFPEARVAIEVGTYSPWISRLLPARGMEVTVANARKLRAIHDNDRKCDKLDARMMARLLRVDPELLHPIHHNSESAQRDLLEIKLRDTLVRQQVNAIGSLRGVLKSLAVLMIMLWQKQSDHEPLKHSCRARNTSETPTSSEAA